MANNDLVEKIKITLNGETAIMFDKFTGQEKDTKTPEQKFYFFNGNIVLPAENIYAFLFGENPAGCAKSFEGKKGKEFIRTGMAYLIVKPESIPFQRNGKNLTFTSFDGDLFDVCEYAPRTKMSGSPNTIKQNLKRRPLLLPPWSLTFEIEVMKNPLIDIQRLYNWFSQGGKIIGIGTYRPRFGRFSVKIE